MRKRRIWEKIDLSEYNLPDNNISNEIELNKFELDEIEKSNTQKITLEDIFPSEKDDDLDEELKSIEKEDRDWYSGVTEEEIIMTALENGYGDLYGFD